jgi:hypothetical protein
MSDFDLLENYIENLEALLRKSRSRTVSSSATPSITEPLALAPSATTIMAHKTLCEFSIPTIDNMPIGPAINLGDKNFELRTRLITMV